MAGSSFSVEVARRGTESILELSFLHTLHLVDSPLALQTILVPTITASHTYGSGDDAVFYAPLSAAAPRIESFDVQIEIFLKTSLVDLFRALSSSVREIRISDFCLSYNIFDDPISESLIPKSIARACRGLLRFIKSRTLQRVAIRFDREMQLEIRPNVTPSSSEIRVPGCSFEFFMLIKLGLNGTPIDERAKIATRQRSSRTQYSGGLSRIASPRSAQGGFHFKNSANIPRRTHLQPSRVARLHLTLEFRVWHLMDYASSLSGICLANEDRQVTVKVVTIRTRDKVEDDPPGSGSGSVATLFTPFFGGNYPSSPGLRFIA
ncbi:hypothetical protein DFH09DRAFT_1079086 [Mycena vulgaris]|nr:hypothetical protein DFH09DRAFT_1079086 [Mycena vulgaris]